MTNVLRNLSAALADRYLVEGELGAGGMATVYLAHDVRHDRKVALKVLRPELAAILGGERFLQEIKTTANLQHPHILPQHDSGTVGRGDGGTEIVYYVMPYVEGESLRDRLKREHQLPVDEAIRIASEVADALEYAHGHGIVHRDIKPENILLHGGHALVADFGIALAASRSDGGTRMTETGMSLGTPHYMAPEQAMGEREITPKADIYALGCVLYEMLTGEPPFTGPTAQAIIARVVTEEPRSLTLQRKTIPPYVEAAIRTALQKLPADRFSSAAQFAQALRNPAFAGVAAPAAAAAGARRSLIPDARRLAPWLAASVVAAVALAGGFLSGRLTAPKPPSRLAQFFIEPPESVTGFNRCCGRALAISPDGSTLVFVGVRGSSGPLYRRTLGRLGAEPIPGTEGASIPIFSPDGRWLAFHSDGRLRKVSMAGGPAVPITSAEQVVGASWGEGDIIVYSSQRRLWSVRAAGGQSQPLTSPDSNTRHFFPFVLPGGRAVVFSIRDASGNLELSRIGVMRFGRETVDTVAFGARAEYASGFLVYTGADNTLLAQPFDAERLVPLGEAVAIQDRIRLAGGSNHEFSVSAEGTLVFQPGAGGSGGGEVLRIFGPGGRTAVQLPGRSDVNLEDPAASPDGRLIALRLPTGGATSQDLWILDRQQGTLERFTVGGGAAPAWSRNGRLIAYYADSGQGGPAGIYVKASDQTGPARLVAAGTSLFPGSWLPDGRTIVFQSRADLEANIGMVAIGDSAPTWLVATEFREAHPQASPDGRWLAYVSNRTGQNEVFVQPLRGEGGRTQISTEGATAPRWSPDGRTLYYVAGGAVVAARLGFGPSVRVSERRIVVDGGVTDLNGTNVNWDVFSNGGEFIYIDQQGTGAARLVWMLNWTELVRGMRTSQ